MIAPLDTELDPYSLPPHLVPIAIRLADEGIPVMVIARGLKQPSDKVRESLHDAVHSGAIAEIPKEDWPPTAKKGDRLPVSSNTKMSDDDLVFHCMKVFKVTRLQASVLIVLIKREKADKETLHSAIELRRRSRQNKPSNMDETDPKMVDVVICNLRKRLKPFDVFIKTLWGTGYYIEHPYRVRALELISQLAVPPTEVVPNARPATE